MIRQPDFVTEKYALEIIGAVKVKKPLELLDQIIFTQYEEGRCIQMLHTGSYDNEYHSFRKMEEYAESIGLKRLSHHHKEIYLSDPRKTESQKLKTVLRFQVKE